MVNPGIFHGLRKEFLTREKVTYSNAVASDNEKDAIADIQRRFFKRFPVDLPLNEEPSAERLMSVNDSDADPDVEEPDENAMTAIEYAFAKFKSNERAGLIVLRKGQIKRWLEYQYMKDRSDAKGDSRSKAADPYRLLLSQLTGTSDRAPRLRSAVNLWRKLHTKEIEKEVSLRAIRDDVDKKKLAPVREKVAKEMFEKLSLGERDEWAKQAKEEHEVEIQNWKQESTSLPSTCPADRQRCIQNLTSFVQPILDGICDATGWKASLIAGGPEPVHSGKLNVISVHSGVTSGDIRMNFGRAEQSRFKKYIFPIFGDFLRRCYTPQECRACALPAEEDLGGLDLQDVYSFNVDSMSTNTEGRETVPPHSSTSARDPSPFYQNVATITLSSNERRSPSPPCGVPTPESPLNSPADLVAINPFPWLVNELPYIRGDDALLLDDSPAAHPFGGEVLPVTTSSSNVQQGEGVISDVPTAAYSSLAVVQATSNAAFQQVQPRLEVQDEGSMSVMPLASSNATLMHPTSKATIQKVQLQPEQGQDSDKGPTSVNTVNRTTRCGQPKRALQETVLEDRDDKRRCTSDRDSRVVNRARDAKGAGPSENPVSAAPLWFLSCYRLFSDQGLGKEWDGLISSWATFEAKEDYKESGRPTASGRPDCVAQWISRRRSVTWRPKISDVKGYEGMYNEWWKRLQPAWRVVDGRVDVGLTQGDWESLRLPGMNGFLSIIAALFYWGLAVEGKARRNAWLSAVQDCHLVINSLLSA